MEALGSPLDINSESGLYVQKTLVENKCEYEVVRVVICDGGRYRTKKMQVISNDEQPIHPIIKYNSTYQKISE